MKPNLFIGSSTESLTLAYHVQSNLDRDANCTVWTQGVFTISKTGVESLIKELQRSDFGIFILSPDDVTTIRDKTQTTVRDNVIFELGMFIGKLGNERCFMLVPRDVGEIHLPTDLLGLNPATFDANRTDGNIQASLGPACNSIRVTMQDLGSSHKTVNVKNSEVIAYSNPDDCIALIQSWMSGRASSENLRAINFKDVDRELNLVAGSTETFIEQAARHWGYTTTRKGLEFILFSEHRSFTKRL